MAVFNNLKSKTENKHFPKGGRILQTSILNRNIKNIENIELVKEDNKYYINFSMIIETESSVDRCKAKLKLPFNMDANCRYRDNRIALDIIYELIKADMLKSEWE